MLPRKVVSLHPVSTDGFRVPAWPCQCRAFF